MIMIYLNKKIKVIFIGFLSLVIFSFIPNITFAASAYFTSDYSSISVGDTIIVNLMLDPKGKKPNVVEGNVLIKEGSQNIKVSNLSIANSKLTYWPQMPSLDNGSNISFLGGTPGGFNSAGILFKIIFTANAEGQVTFFPSEIKAYNNDEKSTPLDVSSTGLTISIGSKAGNVSKDQWLDITSADNLPPKDLSAVVGQDASLFDNKKFITIHATDEQSGISYYEVKEGSGSTVRSGDTYVLQDQKQLLDIIVTAYDKSGNYSKIILKPVGGKNNYLIWIIVLVIVVLVVYIIFRKLKKKKIISK